MTQTFSHREARKGACVVTLRSNGLVTSFRMTTLEGAFRTAQRHIYNGQVKDDSYVGQKRFQKTPVRTKSWDFKGTVTAEFFECGVKIRGPAIQALLDAAREQYTQRKTADALRLKRLDESLAKIKPRKVRPVDLGDD